MLALGSFAGGIALAWVLMKYLNLGNLSNQGLTLIPVNLAVPEPPQTEPEPIVVMEKEEERYVGGSYNQVVSLQGSSVWYIDKDENGDYINWAEVIIDNDGPGTIYYSVNKWTRPTVGLNAGQHLHLDYKRPIIKKLYLRTDAGTTASVNLHAIW